MTTTPDFIRSNFNWDQLLGSGGSTGDLFLFDNFGNKAIWLENAAGGRLATSPAGFNLPFTGPTWHIAAIADFDNPTPRFISPDGNPTTANDLLWVNDNGALALWQSTGSSVNPFSGNF